MRNVFIMHLLGMAIQSSDIRSNRGRLHMRHTQQQESLKQEYCIQMNINFQI